MRQQFFAAPPGQAREAFQRGDLVFQYSIAVQNTQAIIIPMGGATTATTTTDPVVILNAVCREGWDLINGSFVFHETGSESRDKFLASGQHVAVSGIVIGYYLFRRSEENRTQSRDPWIDWAIDRVCPHCGQQIKATAEVCFSCGDVSYPWRYQDGRWWRTVDGEWELLDETTGT